MPFEKVHERLARLYPLHYQTIVERMYQDYLVSMGDIPRYLNGTACQYELACCFHWERTPEGARYWEALGRAETLGA